MRRAPSSLGSLVRGLLHRSMVLAAALVALPHQVSHHSHSCVPQPGWELPPVSQPWSRRPALHAAAECLKCHNSQRLPSTGKKGAAGQAMAPENAGGVCRHIHSQA